MVDAVNCAREIQNAMVERNAGLHDDQRIVFRIGIHLGDVIEESGRRSDGRRRQYRRAARKRRQSRRDLPLRDSLLARQVAARSEGRRSWPDTVEEHRRPGARLFFGSGSGGRLCVGKGEAEAEAAGRDAVCDGRRARRAVACGRRLVARRPRDADGGCRPSVHCRVAFCKSLGRRFAGLFRRRHHRESDDRTFPYQKQFRHRPQHGVHFQR